MLIACGSPGCALGAGIGVLGPLQAALWAPHHAISHVRCLRQRTTTSALQLQVRKLMNPLAFLMSVMHC